ncbi:outer membrane protein assembly factor BamE [Candidatus Albibeggiatoa sp. nov. BB20]|uniref:outer membrane protein assembly factor BamE n=1 Tax=Candidatus Albibeggiatoa sp. nov. BB20 TaxID=3162723 RepID=UPI0033655222
MQKFILVFIFSLLVSNCSLYKIDVQQGNVITQEMLDQLEQGMSARKVRFIMGTPLLQDAFHQNRWDYLFSFQEGNSGKRQQQVISLFFDDESQLTGVKGNVEAGQAKPDTTIPTIDPQDTQPIL